MTHKLSRYVTNSMNKLTCMVKNICENMREWTYLSSIMTDQCFWKCTERIINSCVFLQMREGASLLAHSLLHCSLAVIRWTTLCFMPSRPSSLALATPTAQSGWISPVAQATRHIACEIWPLRGSYFWWVQLCRLQCKDTACGFLYILSDTRFHCVGAVAACAAVPAACVCFNWHDFILESI